MYWIPVSISFDSMILGAWGYQKIRNERSLVGGRQKTRAPKRRSLGRLGWGDHDEAGEILVFAAEAIQKPRAETRSRKSLFARIHLQAGAIMVDVVRHHGPNDAKIIDALRDFRK